MSEDAVDWITAKRDGAASSDEQIQACVAAFTAGSLPDYQMAALAMAIYLQGMSATETAALTSAMLH